MGYNSSLPSKTFFYTFDILLILLQFLYTDNNILSFGKVDLILENALSESLFVLCFFEKGDFVLIWVIFILLFFALLSSSFFVLLSIYLF